MSANNDTFVPHFQNRDLPTSLGKYHFTYDRDGVQKSRVSYQFDSTFEAKKSFLIRYDDISNKFALRTGVFA